VDIRFRLPVFYLFTGSQNFILKTPHNVGLSILQSYRDRREIIKYLNKANINGWVVIRHSN